MISEDQLAAACRRNGVTFDDDIRAIQVAVISAMRSCVSVGGMIANEYQIEVKAPIYSAIGEQLKKDAPSVVR